MVNGKEKLYSERESRKVSQLCDYDNTMNNDNTQLSQVFKAKLNKALV